VENKFIIRVATCFCIHAENSIYFCVVVSVFISFVYVQNSLWKRFAKGNKKKRKKRGRKPPWNQAVAQAPTRIQLQRPSRSGPERGQPGAPLLSLSLSDRAGPPVSGRLLFLPKPWLRRAPLTEMESHPVNPGFDAEYCA